MMPFYFGKGSRRLFGVYDPAVDPHSLRAAVICAPWGPDSIPAHPSLRRLALNLSAAGRHVLRFDYFGSGDSAGETLEADLDGWLDDVGEAIEELKSMVGATRVSLIGMRLGASLAAKAAARRDDIEALTLWDPVICGRSYMSEMLQEHEAFLADRTRYTAFAPSDTPNIRGFATSLRMKDQIAALDLLPVAAALRPRILLVITKELPEQEAFIGSLSAGGALDVEYVGDNPPWKEYDLGFGGRMPSEALGKATAWNR